MAFKSSWTLTSKSGNVKLELNAKGVMGKIQKLYYNFSRNNRYMEELMLEIANIGARYAKSNHKWRNQTGDAEKGLKGSSQWESKTTVTAAISHSVYYGVYLERGFQRRYAILEDSARYAAGFLADKLSNNIKVSIK